MPKLFITLLVIVCLLSSGCVLLECNLVANYENEDGLNSSAEVRISKNFGKGH
jgi:hypothetical protein